MSSFDPLSQLNPAPPPVVELSPRKYVRVDITIFDARWRPIESHEALLVDETGTRPSTGNVIINTMHNAFKKYKDNDNYNMVIPSRYRGVSRDSQVDRRGEELQAMPATPAPEQNLVGGGTVIPVDNGCRGSAGSD